MTLAAIHSGHTSKVKAFMLKGHLAIETWNMFEKRTTRAVIPVGEIESFLADLRLIVDRDSQTPSTEENL